MSGPKAPPLSSWRERVASAAYAGLMRCLMLPMLLRLYWRGRAEPLYRQHIGERLAIYPSDLKSRAETGRLWLHAVSLGETRAATALVQALRQQRPQLRLLLTHGTATGREAGQALLGPGDLQVWMPWDSPGAVRRFLSLHQPIAGVLMETEIWPAMLATAREQGIPMLLANARLSARSLQRQGSWPALMRPAMQSLTAALAQTEADAARLREAGATHVQVCGNLKFDMTPEPTQLARGKVWRSKLGRQIVMAASTRETEEQPLLAAWKSALSGIAAHKRPLLLLVPRHPQRFDEVAQICLAGGFELARRSDWAGEQDYPPGAVGADIWLGDSLGELPLYYSLADVALLGGSFAPLGGQNLIEAAACGCPLLIGPSSFNFAEAAELAIAAGAASQVSDLPTAVDAALALLADEAGRMSQAQRALTFAGAHRGAAAAMASAILTSLPAAVG